MALDDDDNPFVNPSTPNATSQPLPPDEDDEPETLDWSSLTSKKSTPSAKAIRKGEKDFESHGTRAQDASLEKSRRAMEEALSYTRMHKKEEWCRGWLFSPEFEDDGDRREGERCVVVEREVGGWSKDMGRVLTKGESRDGQPRLWLLPEEALFLVERGNLDLWWPERTLEELVPELNKAAYTSTDDYDVGVPLSLEAAYSLLIGEEGERGKITLPKYQVYAHLKRSGIHVLRAPETITTPEPKSVQKTTLWQWLTSLIPQSKPTPPSWGPLVQPGLYRSYRPIYTQLAILPVHKPTPTLTTSPPPTTPWKVFYHIWKSDGKPFSKRSPPSPDFLIAVTDTLYHGVPTLEQMDALWQSSAVFDDPRRTIPEKGRVHPRIKQGWRSVLVAIVDCGLVNFIRFGEGAFGGEDLVERFDERGRGGGKRGGGRGGGRGGRGRGRGGGRGRGRGS